MRHLGKVCMLVRLGKSTWRLGSLDKKRNVRSCYFCTVSKLWIFPTFSSCVKVKRNVSFLAKIGEKKKWKFRLVYFHLYLNNTKKSRFNEMLTWETTSRACILCDYCLVAMQTTMLHHIYHICIFLHKLPFLQN